MTNLASCIAAAAKRLATSSDSPQLDAELLFSHALALSRTQLITQSDKIPSESELQSAHALIARRLNGEPIAYIMGKREFWSLELLVNEHTLIPRPETELLVELALEKIPQDQAWHIADLGTGSGAIALAIAKERPHCQIHACDTSKKALLVAERNAQHNDIKNIQFHHSDWFQNLAGRYYDLIVSNPPYVAPDDPHLKQGDLRFEPSSALSAENNGFEDLFHIAEQAKSFLKPNSWLLLEHGYEQQKILCEKLNALGYCQVTGHNDHAQQPRAISAQWVA